MNKIISAYESFTKVFAVLSAIGICVMMIVTVIDIFMRAVLNDSLTGSTEIVGMAMVCTVYFGVGYTTFKRGMITVDVVKVPFFIVFICNILSIISGSMFIYSLVQQAGVAFSRGGGTLRLHIPNWPFMYITAFGFVTIILSLVVIMIMDVRNKRRGINIGSTVEGVDEFEDDLLDKAASEITEEIEHIASDAVASGDAKPSDVKEGR